MKLSRVARGLIAAMALIVLCAIGSAHAETIDVVRDDDGTKMKVSADDLPAYWNEANTYRCRLSDGQVWWLMDNQYGHHQCRTMHETIGPPRAGEVKYETGMKMAPDGEYGGFLLAMQFANELDVGHQQMIDSRDYSYSSRPLQMFAGYGVGETTEDGVFRALRASCVDLVRSAQPPMALYNRQRAIEACLDRVVLFSASDEDTGRCAAVIRHDSAHGFLRLQPVFTHESYRGSGNYSTDEPMVYGFGATEAEAMSSARGACSDLAADDVKYNGAAYCQNVVLTACNGAQSMP